jgi:biopolymer transport protein ExbB
MIDMVAAGISEALITTEMGLLVAIPGYFLVSALERRRTLLAGFMAHLESVSVERFQRKGAVT